MAETISIVTETEITDAVVQEIIKGSRDSNTDTGGGFGPKKNPITQMVGRVFKERKTLDATLLKQQMSGLLKVVGSLFEEAEQQTGMRLTEVELSVEISGEGEVSLVGNVAKVGNQGGITLKFTRSEK